MTEMSVKARIVGAVISRESMNYATVTMFFCNPGREALRVVRYRLVWPEGSVTAEPLELVLPSGGSREWSIRVDYRSGDIRALLANPEAGRVEVLETRAKP